jgi:hypothetical protein
VNGDLDEIRKRVHGLTMRFGAGVMQSLQRYNELLQQTAAGEMDEARLQDEYIRFAREETERYLRGLIEMSLGYQDALFELARLYNPPFFEQALVRPTESPTASDAPAEAPGLTIRPVTGQAGSA